MTVLACHSAGLAVVPFSGTARPQEVATIVDSCSAQYLVTDAPEIRDALKRVPELSLLGFADLIPGADGVAAGDADPAHPPLRHHIDTEQLAFGVFTSGSTGRPKGIGFTQYQMRLLVTVIGHRLGYRRDDVVHCALPLSFDYGYYQILLSLVAGCRLVLSGNTPRAVLPRELARNRVTVLPVVPTLLRMYLIAEERSSVRPPLRLVTNTGERLPAQLQILLARLHPDTSLALMYGLSECKRVSIGLYPAALLPRADVGRALTGTEVTIVDADGRPVPPGTPGEIVVRGPHVSWLPLTAASVRRPGRHSTLTTGDIGTMDEDGVIQVEGRAEQQLKINGVRAARTEIEQAAERIPGVLQAHCAVADDTDLVTLWIVGSIEPAELYRGLRDEIDPMKIPGDRRIVDRIPVNANGKLFTHSGARS